MINAALILGNSGTGKSTSIRTLNPSETFVINVLDKPLPFKGSMKSYIKVTKDIPNGNYFATDKASNIVKIISSISERQDIKYLVIDDFGYIMTQDFMSRALIKGFDKFSEIAVSFWSVLNAIKSLRQDITCFVMMHSEIKEDGIAKPKLIGKMLDEKVCVEGMFTHVLHSMIVDGEYKFLTNSDNQRMAKMPMGMFDQKFIDNDLKFLADKMSEYYSF